MIYNLRWQKITKIKKNHFNKQIAKYTTQKESDMVDIGFLVISLRDIGALVIKM